MSAVVEAPPSRRSKELEVMVFFTGNDHLEYLAGHFLTIDPHQFESLERFTAFLTVLNDLLSIGVKSSQIKRESYG